MYGVKTGHEAMEKEDDDDDVDTLHEAFGKVPPLKKPARRESTTRQSQNYDKA